MDTGPSHSLLLHQREQFQAQFGPSRFQNNSCVLPRQFRSQSKKLFEGLFGHLRFMDHLIQEGWRCMLLAGLSSQAFGCFVRQVCYFLSNTKTEDVLFDSKGSRAVDHWTLGEQFGRTLPCVYPILIHSLHTSFWPLWRTFCPESSVKT